MESAFLTPAPPHATAEIRAAAAARGQANASHDAAAPPPSTRARATTNQLNDAVGLLLAGAAARDDGFTKRREATVEFMKLAAKQRRLGQGAARMTDVPKVAPTLEAYGKLSKLLGFEIP